MAEYNDLVEELSRHQAMAESPMVDSQQRQIAQNNVRAIQAMLERLGQREPSGSMYTDFDALTGVGQDALRPVFGRNPLPLGEVLPYKINTPPEAKPVEVPPPPQQQLDLAGIARGAGGGKPFGYKPERISFDEKRRLDLLAKAYDPIAAMQSPEAQVFDAEAEYDKLMLKDKAKRRGYDQLGDTDKFNLGAQLALSGLRQMGSRKHAGEALAESLDPVFRGFTAAQQRAYEEDLRDIAERRGEGRERLGFRKEKSKEENVAARQKYIDALEQQKFGIQRAGQEIGVLNAGTGVDTANVAAANQARAQYAAAQNAQALQQARAAFEARLSALRAQGKEPSQKDVQQLMMESAAKSYGAYVKATLDAGNEPLTMDEFAQKWFKVLGTPK